MDRNKDSTLPKGTGRSREQTVGPEAMKMSRSPNFKPSPLQGLDEHKV